MAKINRFFLLLLGAAWLCGCSSITNLTPSRYPRNDTGYYRVEAVWKSDRQAVRDDSFQPIVVVGSQTYPMRPVPLVADRWEAFIPLSADKDSIHYYFKFDYLVNKLHGPQPDSLKSADYSLTLTEKK